MSAASSETKPLSDWLKSAFEDLAKEAHQSHRRLIELTRQHRAWHASLAAASLRRHARAPKALDLLAVVSIGLVARHVGCTHVAAGKIIERLVGHGILIEQTSRSRHKIFIAGDLPGAARGEIDSDVPLILSDPAPAVDVDALGATLDGLFSDLDRLNQRVEGQVRAGGVATVDGMSITGE